MKKLIILAIIAFGGYYLVQEVFFKADSQAVMAYKQFANAYVVRDYKEALIFASGSVVSDIEAKQSRSTMKFMGRTVSTPLSGRGRLERAMYNIKSEESSGNSVDIVASMRASISWPGMTANPNAPGSYIGHQQTATLQNTASGWKVIRFTDKIYKNPK